MISGVGYSRPWWDFTGLNAGHDYTSEAGIKGISTIPSITGFPHIVTYGYNSWGDGSYIPNPNNEESFFVIGPHELGKGIPQHPFWSGYTAVPFRFHWPERGARALVVHGDLHRADFGRPTERLSLSICWVYPPLRRTR